MDQAEHDTIVSGMEDDHATEIREMEKAHEEEVAGLNEKITELENRAAEMSRTFSKIEELASDY